jgi:cytochrome c oxidase cbb3-type subunit 3
MGSSNGRPRGRKARNSALLGLGISLLGASCSLPPTAPDAGSTTFDAGRGADGGQPTDGGRVLSGGADAGTPPDGGLAYPADVTRGASLYGAYCALCHGEEGQGYLADNANALAHPAFLAVATDAFLTHAIRYGRPGTPMSAWGLAEGGRLADDEIADLVAFLRSWQTETPAEVHEAVIRGDPTVAAPIYAARCQSCHGERGVDGTYLSLANPRFLESVSDGYLRYSIDRGRPGTPMPTFGAGHADTTTPSLSSDELDHLTALLRSWETEPVVMPPPPAVPDVSDPVINAGGPDAAFVRRDDRFVPADDVKAAIDNGSAVILLDARPASDYVLGHISGAISVPFYQVPEVVDALPQDVWIIAYCGCPHAVSGQAFDALAAAGFTKIGVLDEGYYVWRDRGYPVTTGNERGDPRSP